MKLKLVSWLKKIDDASVSDFSSPVTFLFSFPDVSDFKKLVFWFFHTLFICRKLFSIKLKLNFKSEQLKKLKSKENLLCRESKLLRMKTG